MASNIEIKARARDFETQRETARRLADGPPQRLAQEDTFFRVAAGRLKLREFGDGTAELIQYHRADAPGPRQSRYIRSPAPEPASLKAALTEALGVRAAVRKRRTVYLSGQTRIHFDEVDGLGRFIELEVVLLPDQDPREGDAEAERLMAELGIREDDLVTGAYVDLLSEAERGRGRA